MQPRGIRRVPTRASGPPSVHAKAVSIRELDQNHWHLERQRCIGCKQCTNSDGI